MHQAKPYLVNLETYKRRTVRKFIIIRLANTKQVVLRSAYDIHFPWKTIILLIVCNAHGALVLFCYTT